MSKPSIQSSYYPFGYDKNGSGDRKSKSFTDGFNQWAIEIREALATTASIAEARLEEAKKLIGL